MRNKYFSDSSNAVVSFETMTAVKDSVKRLTLHSNSHNRCLNLQTDAAYAPTAKPLKHSVTPSKHDAHSAVPAAVEPVAALASANQGLSANQAISDEEQLRLQQEQQLAELQAAEEQAEQQQSLKQQADEQQQVLAAITAAITETGAASAVQQHQYQPACDLDALGYTGPANELGTWMHRLYQVQLQQPALLHKAMAMAPCAITDPAQQQALQAHLNGFRSALETLCGGIKTLHCEVPVTGLNSKGQVISGVIDLLVEDSQGRWWIVDHKTDKEAVSKGYWEQLQAYQRILQQTRSVAGCVLNWTRHGEMGVTDQTH